MYLGYQGNKIKFYTEEQLNPIRYNLDKIEETQDEYVFDGDEYVLNDAEYIAKYLVELKEEKIKENDIKRDNALYQGVMYKDVLFDSDTDQKANLIATVSFMNDDDIVEWFGMDNIPLFCKKADLFAIGQLIMQLHAFCWNRNNEIKTQINDSKTIEELDAIEIDYNFENYLKEL